MPNSAYDQAIKEAYASVRGTAINTLEIRHENLTQPIRVCLNGEDITARLEATAPANPNQMVVFQACGFSLTRPDVSSGIVKEMEFSIDNVDRAIVESIEAVSGSSVPAECTFREYLTSDLAGGPSNDPPMHLVLTRANARMTRVTAAAGFPDLSAAEFPVENYRLT